MRPVRRNVVPLPDTITRHRNLRRGVCSNDSTHGRAQKKPPVGARKVRAGGRR